jgi:hypothetical protein
MPSIDTIVRNVKIQGSAPGVDQATASLNQLKDAIAAANDNLAKSNAAAQSGSDGFNVAGISALSAANHLRQAAEAAYIFSPAFRGVVNEMRAPALTAASTALEAVATGLVKGTNIAGTGLLSLSAAAEKVAPQFLGLTSYVRSAGIAMEAFAPTAAGAGASILGVAGSVITRFAPVVGQILLAVDAVKLLASSWSLASDRIEQYNAISNNAAGLSTDFYQRITKAADDLKLSTDGLTAAFKSLNDAMAPSLGGSVAQQRLKELRDAGNFAGNTGVAQLNAANNPEEQLKAVANLYKQAADNGQRLAGLDLVKTVLGPEIAGNLAKDTDYLDQMLAKAQAISASSIASDSELARAVDIQTRTAAAYASLTVSWHPFQETLTETGVKLHETFLSDLEDIAAILNLLNKGIDLAQRWLSMGWDKVKNGLSGDVTLVDASGSPYQAYIPGSVGPLNDNTPSALDQARARLRSGLLQPNQVTNARDMTNAVHDNVIRDRSHKTGDGGDDTDYVDRAINSLQRHTQQQIADTAAVGLGEGALAKFRAEAAQTAAIQANGGEITAEQKKRFDDLVISAGAAADALARAKVASQIDFSSKTAFLSQDDVQIAQQLKGIYGNNVPEALNSTYASAIRVNNAFKEISSAIETNLTSGLTDIVSGTTSVSQGFANMASSIAKSIEQMIIKLTIVQPLMNALQNSVSGSGILSFLGVGGSGAAAQATSASALANNTGGAFFGPGFADGGYTGAGGRLEIAGAVHKGEYVFDAANTNRIGVANLDRLRGYADGGYVGSTPANNNSPQNVHVTVSVEMDANGQWQGFVKNVSQQSAAGAVNAFATSPQFPDHVAGAYKTAKTQRKIA